jgi:hypothetical protein
MKWAMAGDANRASDSVMALLDESWAFSANFSTDILHLGDIKNIVVSTSF